MVLSPKTLLWMKAGLHLICIIPVLLLIVDVSTGRAGGDPVQYIIHFTGIGALNCLLATLLVSPMAKILKFAGLMKVRRLLGLYVFFYACLHLAAFISFDLLFDWSLFFDEVVSRPYILIGMINWLLLLALSITSLMSIRAKMGKQWQRLHNSIYLIALLTLWHFYWSIKSGGAEVAMYLAVILLLFLLREKSVQKKLIKVMN
ncbi:protein-methionine-sulfoxide reductase heme-binding subunit MsrQ [Shewanella sp. NIFS-20-20]|nr:protein-methionine-sulfoxide reductase heme-binding subunit MsrQ [Shewanella sp. NIFS-20-20]